MRKTLTTLAVLALSLGAVAGATAAPKRPTPPKACFWARDVNNFAASGRDKINFRVGVRDFYQAELFGPCDDINWTERLALRTRSGSDRVCGDLDLELIVPSAIGPQHCQVTHLRRLSPAEVAALPKRERP